MLIVVFANGFRVNDGNCVWTFSKKITIIVKTFETAALLAPKIHVSIGEDKKRKSKNFMFTFIILRKARFYSYKIGYETHSS